MNILISGATSGIGRYLSERLLADRNNIWGVSRSANRAIQHPSFRASLCDVSDWEQVVNLANDVANNESFAQLHAIILCAAQQGPISPAMRVNPIAWSATARVNLDGTFYMIRAFYDLLRGTRGNHAKVLCFSGGGAAKPRANFSAYSVSKTAVVRLVENLAEEWSGIPIDINAFAPGALPTKMTNQILELGASAAGEKEVANANDTLKLGSEAFERLGALVDFLLSPASDGISGKLISAHWDHWQHFAEHKSHLQGTDIFTLRRITPEDRRLVWK